MRRVLCGTGFGLAAARGGQSLSAASRLGSAFHDRLTRHDPEHRFGIDRRLDRRGTGGASATLARLLNSSTPTLVTSAAGTSW